MKSRYPVPVYLYSGRELVSRTSKFKLLLQGKKQTNKQNQKQPPKNCYVILQSDLILKPPIMKIINVCQKSNWMLYYISYKKDLS